MRPDASERLPNICARRGLAAVAHTTRVVGLCVYTFGCDPHGLDTALPVADAGASHPTGPSADRDAGTPTDLERDAGADRSDGGMSNAAGDSGASAAGSGESSSGGAGAGGRTAGTGGASGAEPPSAGGGGTGQPEAGSGGSAGGVAKDPCPSPPDETGSFCYDFEDVEAGASGPAAYQLTAHQGVSVETLETGSNEHVLVARVPAEGDDSSANIQHHIDRFSRLEVSFDMWLGQAELGWPNTLIWVQLSPAGVSDHTQFVELRADAAHHPGKALLTVNGGSESESGTGSSVALLSVPQADSKTHVRLVVDRSSGCAVRAYFDEERVDDGSQGACDWPADGDAELYLGLVDLAAAPRSGVPEARYDNLRVQRSP